MQKSLQVSVIMVTFGVLRFVTTSNVITVVSRVALNLATKPCHHPHQLQTLSGNVTSADGIRNIVFGNANVGTC